VTACTERQPAAPDNGVAGEGQKGMAKGGSAMTAALSRATEVALPPLTSLPRRVLKHPALMHYNRLIALVLVANLAVLAVGDWSEPGGLADMALANMALAVLIRQQYVINLLFRLATAVPVGWPLRVRWTLAKVYHFGGLHVGGAVAGTLWFLAYAVRVRDVISYALGVLLVVLAASAVRPVRTRFHDLFELVHRFGGWTALLLLWVQTVLLHRGNVLSAPAFWVLAVVTFSVALPWLRLRRVAVAVERPSSHVALARFDHGVTPFAGSSTAVSRSPLREWHSFANVPEPGRSGFRLTISRAGDWTGSFIDDAPSRVWVKGITTAGVANIETLFTRVVYVATGSGIGPCLPHLLAAEVPARLLWMARRHRETYGDALVDEILAAQPDAVLWDTAEHGKPDAVSLAYQVYRSFGAEAVICISNQRFTWQVVYGLERRGIPAFGAIWDS
jgi:hypothetical protein